MALASRAPVLAVVLAVAAAATPAAAFPAASKAKTTLAGLFASVESATLYAIASALVSSLVIATWVARRSDLAERFPTLATRGRSRLRLFVETEIGLVGPALLFGAVGAAPALIAVSGATPGGFAAIIAWIASTLTIAGAVSAAVELVRARPLALNVLILLAGAATAWIVPAAVLEDELLVGPAAVAAHALAGTSVALSLAVNLAAAAVVWAAVLRSLVLVPRRERLARGARRPRRLPGGATRATTSALLREVTRTPRARFTVAIGLALGVGGPLGIHALVPIPPAILLLVEITTTGTSAAILASVAASRAAALGDTLPGTRTDIAASLAALTIAVSFSIVSSGALLVLSGGALGDVLIILKPAVFGIAAAVVTARINLGSDEELEQLRVAVYALLATTLNLASTLLPIPLALALGAAVLVAGCLPARRRPRTAALPDYVRGPRHAPDAPDAAPDRERLAAEAA